MYLHDNTVVKKIDLELIKRIRQQDTVRFINLYKIHSLIPLYNSNFWGNWDEYWRINNMKNIKDSSMKGNQVDIFV